MRRLFLLAAALLGIISGAQAQTPSQAKTPTTAQKLLLLGGGGSSPFILDRISTTSAGAYGLRKMRGASIAALINIRRTSDSATEDVLPLRNGNFPVAAVQSGFCNGTTCFVTKWYDQSGAGNDLVQATAGLQPQLIFAGQNGKPIIRFSSGAFLARNGFAPTTATNLTLIGVVANYTSPGVNGRLWSFTDTVGGFDFSSGYELGSASTTAWDISTAGVKGNPAVAKTFGFSSASFHQLSAWYTTQGTNNAGLVADQGTATTASNATPAATIATAFFDIGAGLTNASPQSNPLICDYAEMIIFASDLSAAASRNPIEQNQKTYWATP